MALYTPEYKPNGKETATITTNKGVIRVQLHGDHAVVFNLDLHMVKALGIVRFAAAAQKQQAQHRKKHP